MDLSLLDKILASEPAFRQKQARQLVFCDLIEDWSQATTLSLPLRERLNKEIPLLISAKSFVSKKDDSVKALIILADGLKIEAVLMRHKGRNTVCVSSQAGCPLGCKFCVTGQSAFKRNLTSWEIIEQVLLFARLLKKEGERVNNIVFMGMGEPFLNYDNVLAAIRILNDKEGFNLGARHFSVSTIGITEGIKRLSGEGLEINLAISLHAPDNELRTKLMPINKRYSLEKVLKAVDDYVVQTRRRVMLEYIMIKGINDSDKQAQALAKIVRRPLCFVNLIACNANQGFELSSVSRIKVFKEILSKHGITVTQRYRFGEDIKGACGQLVGKDFA